MDKIRLFEIFREIGFGGTRSYLDGFGAGWKGFGDALEGFGDAFEGLADALGRPWGRLGRPFWKDLGKTLEEPPERPSRIHVIARALRLTYLEIQGREAPPYNYFVNTYRRSSRGSSIKICFGSSFS